MYYVSTSTYGQPEDAYGQEIQDEFRACTGLLRMTQVVAKDFVADLWDLLDQNLILAMSHGGEIDVGC